MPKYEITLERREAFIVNVAATNADEAIRAASEMHPRCRATFVNDEEIVGWCDGCAKFLTERDHATPTDDGWLCGKCHEELKEA